MSPIDAPAQRFMRPGWRMLTQNAAIAVGVSVAYFICAKAGLSLASINPSATPIWPPTGLALSLALLVGYRIIPAVLLGAFLANST